MGTEYMNNRVQQAETENVETIDFKMVTFSLAGKDYSIDIMKVKEISHANTFTFVPNSFPFVKGVYNLRGDIISIIDLRILFNLPAPDNADTRQENLIILRLDDYQLGVVVDSIDKVVGINSSNIQPPHPIFGDINIKFIQGVVENDGRLYLILDVEKIFGQEEDFAMVGAPTMRSDTDYHGREDLYNRSEPVTEKERDINFIIETLRTFKKYVVSPVNRGWINRRFEEWIKIKGSKTSDLQLKSESDADEFLSGFYSPGTGRFWDDALRKSFISLLPDFGKNTVTLWNPGCGSGYETYSLAVALKERYPEAAVKIWASDNDLIGISNAPNLVFRRESLPESMERYAVEQPTGLQFSDELKELILFEYHDVMHPNSFLEVDIIVARDIISFLSENDQERLVKEFEEKLRPGGVLVIGKNEKLEGRGWKYAGNEHCTAYVWEGA